MTEFFNTGLTKQQFLTQYWQKKPLLIRQAFADFDPLITPNELAGLACESDIESRLIIEREQQWQLRHGPFNDEDFADLPEQNWTLLVQDVDKHLPEMQTLLQPFNFIPNWRRDDLMISFAADGGSVGPHTDGYDVFLLQAEGSRRWQISSQAIANPKLLADCDLQILETFEPSETWELQAGDMLYLPPHFGHHGVAVGECMTFSIGFRAPKQTEMLGALLTELVETNGGQQHYRDQNLTLTDHEHIIADDAVSRFKQQLHELIDKAEPQLLASLGKLVTETKPSLVVHADDFLITEADETTLSAQFSQGKSLRRNPYYRIAWTGEQLFMAGERYVLPESETLSLILAEQLTLNQTDWQLIQADQQAKLLLISLIEAGGWYWDD